MGPKPGQVNYTAIILVMAVRHRACPCKKTAMPDLTSQGGWLLGERIEFIIVSLGRVKDSTFPACK
jgi:hypothetical protein